MDFVKRNQDVITPEGEKVLSEIRNNIRDLRLKLKSEMNISDEDFQTLLVRACVGVNSYKYKKD